MSMFFGYSGQCLGLTIIIIVGIYLLYKSVQLNSRIFEGLTLKEKPKSAVSDIESKIKLVKRNLEIDENREDIEDVLTKLSEFLQYGQLHTLLQYAKGDMDNSETTKTGRKIEALERMETALRKSLDFLDKIS